MSRNYTHTKYERRRKRAKASQGFEWMYVSRFTQAKEKKEKKQRRTLPCHHRRSGSKMAHLRFNGGGGRRERPANPSSPKPESLQEPKEHRRTPQKTQANTARCRALSHCAKGPRRQVISFVIPALGQREWEREKRGAARASRHSVIDATSLPSIPGGL